MSISVYVETRESVPGHLVKFSKAKLSQGFDQILDELSHVGKVDFWIKKQQVHIEIVRKKYKVFIIRDDGCQINFIDFLTKIQVIKFVSEMMGVK